MAALERQIADDGQRVAADDFEGMAAGARVLLVDDEQKIRSVWSKILVRADFEVLEAGDGAEAVEVLESHSVDVVITDLVMPEMRGEDLVEWVTHAQPDIQIIVVTGIPTYRGAVTMARSGIFDYLPKPLESQLLVRRVREAATVSRLRQENRRLRAETFRERQGVLLETRTATVRAVMDRAAQVAATDAALLLTGETGTGKSAVARAVHENSRRRGKPFVVVDCSALAGSVLESELFGHKRGAFTNAYEDRPGLFESADGGTVFLDEIGDMALEMQTRLLSVLEHSHVRRVGDTRERKIDVRVISATWRSLDESVERGEFRQDLYYRLKVVALHLPPLRERRPDIPALAQHFLREFAERAAKRLKGISVEALQLLLEHPWVGNLRELRNAMSHAGVFTPEDEEITPATLPEHIVRGEVCDEAIVRGAPIVNIDLPFRDAMTIADQYSRKTYLRGLMNKTGGNLAQAARLAQMDRANFRRLLKAHDLR